jgi:hypothetical protein
MLKKGRLGMVELLLQAGGLVACCWLGLPVSTWQVEMGWPDIHWLAGD